MIFLLIYCTRFQQIDKYHLVHLLVEKALLQSSWIRYLTTYINILYSNQILWKQVAIYLPPVWDTSISLLPCDIYGLVCLCLRGNSVVYAYILHLLFTRKTCPSFHLIQSLFAIPHLSWKMPSSTIMISLSFCLHCRLLLLISKGSSYIWAWQCICSYLAHRHESTGDERHVVS